MPFKTVVIASILKPVDDTRLYEKLGQTISQATKYPVNIIGFKTKKLPVDPGVNFHPLYSFHRLSPARLWAPWKFFFKVLRLSPDLLIVSTPELLWMAAVYSLFNRCTLWYDVQENYQRNIQYQTSYASAWKPLLRGWLWLVHTLSKPFIDHYLLAEAAYVEELRIPARSYTILANKFQPLPLGQATKKERLSFIYCGTLSPGYGLLESIELIGQWHASGHAVKLIIMGQVHDARFLRQIQQHLQNGKSLPVDFIYDRNPMPHHKILQKIQQCHFGIVAHQPNASNENCIPTRIYEFLGLGIPFLLQQNPRWESVAAPYHAALVMDFKNFEAPKIWEQLHNQHFYTSRPGAEITWEGEAQKLRELLAD